MQSIAQSDEVPIDASLIIQNDSTYYLRGVFYISGSSKYCGYTYNGQNFYSEPVTTNDGWKNFFPVSTSEGSWSGQLKVKFDPGKSYCQESGEYAFKIQRYTQSGSASFDDQNELVFSVTVPTPTSTVTDTPKPQPTATHTKKPDPTALPPATVPHQAVQSVSITPKPVKSITPTQTITPMDTPFTASSGSVVLGSVDELQVVATESSGMDASRIAGISAAFIGMGFISLSIALYYGIYVSQQKNL